MTSSQRRAALLGGWAVLLVVTRAGAQEAPQTTPAPDTVRGLESLTAPQPTPTPVPTPAAPRIVLPSVIATPSPSPLPVPSASVAPPPRPAATRSVDTPVVTASPSPRPSAAPLPVPTPTTEQEPGAIPDTAASPATAPVPAETPPSDGAPLWAIGIGAAILAAIAAAVFLLVRRKRAASSDDFDVAEPVEEAPPAEVPPAPVAPVVAPIPPVTPLVVPVPAAPLQPRARIAIAYRPVRAGLNMLSATVENEITVTNTGEEPAEGIRLDIRLLGAHADLDADLAALRGAPIGRPAVPPFTLAPGEERRLTTIAALPRDAIPPLTAGNRPMFVPIVALNLLYQTASQPGQTAQAFAVGIERVDSSKLAPLWLDTAGRMHDQVAARPHGAAFERFG